MWRRGLRWAMWLSLFGFVFLTTGGSWRYLTSPESKVPLESLVRTPPRMEEIPDRDHMLLAARAYPGFGEFSTLWPTRLPTRAILTESGQGNSVVMLGWTAEDDWQQRPLLRFRQAYDRRAQLPDLPVVMVRGQVGRTGPASSADCPKAQFSASSCTLTGLWWLENGLSMKLTSSSLSTAELIDIAESLEPLVPPGPIHYQRKTVGRGGYAIAVAGSSSDFPLPSVTYFSDVKVYLVRTLAGYGAFSERQESYVNWPTQWDAKYSRFIEPIRGNDFTLFGRCLAGPCPYDLSRYAVRIERDRVLVDLDTRYTGYGTQRRPPPMPDWALSWP